MGVKPTAFCADTVREVTMRNLIGILGIAALFGTPSSFAGEAYVGASLGVLDLEDDSAGTDFSDTTVSFKVFGGYDFNEYFALDLAFFSTLDDAEDTIFGVPIEVSLDAFVLRGVGAYPTSENFSLLGSIGYWDGDASALGASASEDGITLGIGGKYRFQAVSIRGEFEWFDSDDSIWTVLLGIQYSFGGN